MKKLQIFMLCSVLAIGFADSLQASWFTGKPKEAPKEAPKPDVKPTEAPISFQDAAIREISAKNTAIESGKKVADVVPADALTTQSNNLAEQSKSIFSRRNVEAKNVASKSQGPAKEAAIVETSRASVSDAINATGKPVSAEAETAITAEAVKSAKTWSDTWNESSFKQWIDSIVESVNRYISKFSGKSTASTGIPLGENSVLPDSQQPSTTDSINLGTADAQANTSAEQSVEPTTSATQDLFSNIRTEEQLATQSSDVNQGAKDYAEGAKQANNQNLASWWNVSRGMVGLPPQ